MISSKLHIYLCNIPLNAASSMITIVITCWYIQYSQH